MSSQNSLLTEDQENQLVLSVLEYADEVPSQLIYLQTDKDIYETQENIWFHALLKNAQSLESDTSADVFFLLLINSENEVVTNAKFSINNGVAKGNLYIQDFLNSGAYHLVGYTKESINRDLRFYKTIKQLEIKETLIPKVLVSFKEEANENGQLQLYFDLKTRSGAAATDIKIRLKGITNLKEKILTRATTDSLGKATLVVDPEKVSQHKKVVYELIGKKNLKQRAPLFLTLENDKAPEIRFYPESGSLLNSLNQRVGFKAIKKSGKPTDFKGVLLEDDLVLDTISTNFYGMGSFWLHPKKEKRYRLRSLSSDNHFYELPVVEKTGFLFQLDSIGANYMKLDFSTNDLSNYGGEIFIRLQSKGYIYWMGKGKLMKQKQTFSIPIDKAPTGIIELTVFNKQLEKLYTRLIYLKANHHLYVHQLNNLEKSYKPKSKVVVQLKVKDHHGLPKKAKLNVRVLDHLYDNVVDDRNMSSFFQLESQLKDQTLKPGIYFRNTTTKADSLNLLLLNTERDSYLWSSDTARKHGTFNIQENVVGKVMVTSKTGTLIPSGSSEIQLFTTRGVILFKTNEKGMFRITKEVLNHFKGETLFIKTTTPKEIIQILKNDNNIFQNEKIELSLPQFYTLKNFEKNSSLEDQIRSFNLNSMNYLDEVVVKAQYTSRNKNAVIYGVFMGRIFDYVCVEYNILNCTNHKQGYPPVDGEIYSDNLGNRKVYYAPEKDKEVTSNNKPKDFVAINSFYPEKSFEEVIYKNSEDRLDFDNRKTLYWDTNITTDDDGKATITFFTSDNRGVYKGFVDVYTDDGLFGVYEFIINVY
ncbi:hypothetical protein [Spongiivirga citrea]|uniref:Macroglobulin domain-containing protein n=1 Tax=Spongiivirga citrea TaxID=1481457 RepID=A0A6M0CIF5_9FLAO|nr:hypothetical protein [Spongiivirga citrea]NER17302.1 hypothetical protein [Spongiivirga citrea]